MGLMYGMEWVTDPVTKTHSPALAAWVKARALEAGVLLSTDGMLENVNKIKPPMVWGRAEADRLMSALEGAMRQLTPALRRQLAAESRRIVARRRAEWERMGAVAPATPAACRAGVLGAAASCGVDVPNAGAAAGEGSSGVLDGRHWSSASPPGSQDPMGSPVRVGQNAGAATGTPRCAVGLGLLLDGQRVRSMTAGGPDPCSEAAAWQVLPDGLPLAGLPNAGASTKVGCGHDAAVDMECGGGVEASAGSSDESSNSREGCI